MFRKLFSRKRECPQCGFQGSPRDFKRVKTVDLLDEKTREKLNNASLGIGSSSGDSGTSGTSGTSGEKPKAKPKAKSKRPNKKKATTTSGTSGSSASSTSGSSGVN